LQRNIWNYEQAKSSRLPQNMATPSPGIES
jgi:hypothetical protein